jgi:thiol-disulfide isomerase/thioredoxin
VTGGTWIASYVLLWAAVGVLGLAVVVLLRQIGVLHARLRPQGVHPANEGPVVDAPAPAVGGFGFDRAEVTLLAFTSSTCTLCAALLPSLRALEQQYDDLDLRVVEHGPDTLGVFRAYQVTSTPYVVAVDRTGTVRGGGVANTLEQVEVLLESVLEPV